MSKTFNDMVLESLVELLGPAVKAKIGSAPEQHGALLSRVNDLSAKLDEQRSLVDELERENSTLSESCDQYAADGQRAVQELERLREKCDGQSKHLAFLQNNTIPDKNKTIAFLTAKSKSQETELAQWREAARLYGFPLPAQITALQQSISKAATARVEEVSPPPGIVRGSEDEIRWAESIVNGTKRVGIGAISEYQKARSILKASGLSALTVKNTSIATASPDGNVLTQADREFQSK